MKYLFTIKFTATMGFMANTYNSIEKNFSKLNVNSKNVGESDTYNQVTVQS